MLFFDESVCGMFSNISMGDSVQCVFQRKLERIGAACFPTHAWENRCGMVSNVSLDEVVVSGAASNE